jgi:hypothetical protein
MARVRILNDEELCASIASKYKESKDKQDIMKIEFDACKHFHQGISEYSQGGLDTGLLTNALFQPPQGETTPLNIEGLDLIKAVLFLHSKLCVSEPVVTCTPLNQDSTNKKAAENAQAYIPHFKKHTGLQEELESGPYLNTSVYGNGILYVGWNPDGGDFPLDDIPENVDITTVDFKMEGDYELRNIMPDKFFPDANASCLAKANHAIEEREIEYSEAMFSFDKPEEQAMIDTHMKAVSNDQEIGEMSEQKKKTKLTIYEYWEPGKPWNGFLGAHVFFFDPIAPKILRRENNTFKHRRLPYAMLTDIDIPGNVFGMSRIVYAWQIQKSIDSLITQIMENISLHGSAKFLKPEGATNDDMDTNDPSAIGTFNPALGAQPVQFKPSNVTSDVWRAYEILQAWINNLYGMNEFSQGQIPRELSSYAVQMALEMDDKYRIRLFNKKKQFLRDIYVMGLEITKQFMTDTRKLKVTGIEGFANDEFFSVADIKGDYGVDVDYGQYIPVDPAARKQQLLEFIKSGFFEKAGGDMRKIGPLLVDGSMLDVKNIFEKSAKLQDAEITKILKGEKVEVRKWDDHEAHAIMVDEFIHSATFEALEEELKETIWAHGEKHTEELAKKLAKQKPLQAGGENAGQDQGEPFGNEPPPPARAPPTPVDTMQGPTI